MYNNIPFAPFEIFTLQHYVTDGWIDINTRYRIYISYASVISCN